MIPILILAAVLSVFGGPTLADSVAGGPTVFDSVGGGPTHP
jgi:hypothetical protein